MDTLEELCERRVKKLPSLPQNIPSFEQFTYQIFLDFSLAQNSKQEKIFTEFKDKNILTDPEEYFPFEIDLSFIAPTANIYTRGKCNLNRNMQLQQAFRYSSLAKRRKQKRATYEVGGIILGGIVTPFHPVLGLGTVGVFASLLTREGILYKKEKEIVEQFNKGIYQAKKIDTYLKEIKRR